MKITQVSTWLGRAGAETVALNLSLRLKQRGHRLSAISLLPLPRASSVVDGLREAEIPVISLNLNKHTFWRAMGLKPILDGLEPDIVHAHMFHANIVTRVNRVPSAKLVNTVHKLETRRTRQFELTVDRVTRRLCDAQTAVSGAVRDHYVSKLGILPETMPVIRNGIDPMHPLGEIEIADLRKAWGVGHCNRVLGSVGRLVDQKGYDTLLGLLPKISEAVPDGEVWGLVLIGTGPQEKKLRELAGRTTSKIVVSLPGFDSRASHHIGAMDGFVIPSTSEGFGLTMIEAMGHGLPIVANDLEPLREVSAGYENLKFVSFSDANGEQVPGAIKEILVNYQRGNPMVPFSIQDMTDEYLRLYEDLLG